MGADDIMVRTAAIVVLRHFDVAYSIDLARVDALCAAEAGSASNRVHLSSVPAKALAFGVPPVLLTLDPLPASIGTRSLLLGVTARFHEFGVVALALRIPVVDLAWSDYVALVQSVDRIYGPSASHPVWAQLLARVRGLIGPALVRPTTNALEEDYLLAVVHAFDEPMSAVELQQEIDIVAVLADESSPLSESARRDLLRQSHSYYADDLVVLTWDRAFIYEPRGDSDVADVLEVANAQLLELRYYDELLDAELPRMYDMVEEARGTASVLAARRFALLARRLYTLVAEVTEITEKVDNALQVTEDVYLARIYSAALELFRVPRLGAAVDRKLAIVRDTYTALYDEASGSRAELLELAIILLIVIEIGLAVFR